MISVNYTQSFNIDDAKRKIRTCIETRCFFLLHNFIVFKCYSNNLSDDNLPSYSLRLTMNSFSIYFIIMIDCTSANIYAVKFISLFKLNNNYGGYLFSKIREN